MGLSENATNVGLTKLVGWKSFIYKKDAHFRAKIESNLLIKSYNHMTSIWMVEGLDILMFLITEDFYRVRLIKLAEAY